MSSRPSFAEDMNFLRIMTEAGYTDKSLHDFLEELTRNTQIGPTADMQATAREEAPFRRAFSFVADGALIAP
jgi:hypothetical protein